MDRSNFVSANVYGKLYGRPRLDVDKWKSDVLVVYMDPGEEELRRRLAERGDDLFDVKRIAELCQVYAEELCLWPYVFRSCDAQKIADIAKRCHPLIARIAKLKDTRGKYVTDLGSKPVTPCIEVAERSEAKKLSKIFAGAMLGPKPADAWLLHRCDNPLCIRGDHFFYGTHKDNVHDMFLKGRGINRITADIQIALLDCKLKAYMNGADKATGIREAAKLRFKLTHKPECSRRRLAKMEAELNKLRAKLRRTKPGSKSWKTSRQRIAWYEEQLKNEAL